MLGKDSIPWMIVLFLFGDRIILQENGEDALAFPNSSAIIQSAPRRIFVRFGSKYG